MVARVESFVLQGIDAVPCDVEVDVSPTGLPKTTVVGLPDAAVRESIERVRTALLNSGYRYPPTRLTINLAPADVRKEGPVYDLPIAVAILQANGTIAPPLVNGGRCASEFLIAGELALDGAVRRIKGGISLALLARRLEKRGVIVPRENAAEAAAVGDIEVYGVASMGEVVQFLAGQLELRPQPPVDAEGMITRTPAAVDFGDVRGQEAAKRALTVAAAGGHNVLMIGPAGTGKTMMAKALPGVLPPLTRAEALEVTRIYSSVGCLPRDQPLILRRPVRAPHHTASSAAIIGGGSIPRPGDVSLAHRGVLFLDEMPEFSRHVLETLRQPLEDGCVTIARVHGSVRFPARFMLVGALNPTPGGDAATDERSQVSMDRYLGRLSSPLVDRVDVHVEVPAVSYAQLTGTRRGTTTEDMRRRVLDARSAQTDRQGPTVNCELSGKHLDECCILDRAGAVLLEQVMTELGLSARAYDKVRRVARTVADLEASVDVKAHHVAEAAQYRLLDRRV